MAGAKCHLKTPGNFQQSAMLEGSEITEPEGPSSDSTLASSVTTCKKVLCGNGALDSADYWARNEKALCRLGLLDADADDADGSGCTTICFVSLNRERMDGRDDKGIKQRLASVSPDLPKMVESLSIQQPKEEEVLLLGGLQAPDSLHSRSQASTQGQQQQQRGPDVCLVQCSGQKLSSYPANIILEINRFLIGLQWGKDRHLQQQQQQQAAAAAAGPGRGRAAHRRRHQSLHLFHRGRLPHRLGAPGRRQRRGKLQK
ncbi:hypothetical protein CRUP_022684, partial [Coryphaenoides rupestris]